MDNLNQNTIHSFAIGPMQNNSFLIIDDKTKECVVIDPAFDSETIVEFCLKNQYNIRQIWLTHGHFDHIAGVQSIADSINSHLLDICLHEEDLELYRHGGDASQFGIHIGSLPEPTVILQHQHTLTLGDTHYRVLHTPGHTPGHVTFYSKDNSAAFCGDLIFYRSIGRTDLSGGSYQTLITSVQEQIFTLPPDTRLLNGHGPETNVADEKAHNPFFQ